MNFTYNNMDNIENFIEKRLSDIFNDINIDEKTIKNIKKSNNKLKKVKKEEINNDNIVIEEVKNKSSKKTKKTKDPDAPKRNRSAYLFFGDDKRKESNVISFSQIAEMWKNLSDTEKEPYNEMAIVDKKRYERDKKDYENNKN